MLSPEDEELLNFKASEIDDYATQNAMNGLQGEHRDAFRTHLIAARWIDHWREGVERSAGGPAPSNSADWHEGFSYALKEVAAHLRLGDFLPGAQPYEQAKPKAD